MARLSRKLVDLHCEVPLPQPLETLALEGIPADPLKAFLEHHGFNSLLARLGAGAAKAVVAAATAPAAARPEPEAPRLNTTPAIDRSQYETVTTEADLDRWIAAAYAEGVLAIDTETDSLDSITGGLAGICLAVGPNRACYIPVGHRGADMFSDAPQQLPLDLVIARRSEEHTSELQSLMRNSYAVFCL